MPTLQLKNTVSKIVAPPDIHLAISDLLSFEIEGAEHIRRRLPKSAVWDGRKRLLKKDGSFPAGLTPVVIKWLLDHGHGLPVIEDLREWPKTLATLPVAEGLIPRPYQHEAVAISAERPRGIFVMGTGAGKTITAMLIIASRGVPTLFITPDKGLREQAAAEFARWLGHKNVGTKIAGNELVIVANIHQVPKAPDKAFERFRMLMIDEFHHSAALTYLKLNQLAANCFWRYGFTGTNIRVDGKDMLMHGVLSSVLLSISASDLIKQGYLVPPFVTVKRHRVKGWSRFNYREAYKRMVTDEDFNGLITSIARCKIRDERKQTLILVRFKEHGEIVNRMLGGDAEYICGDDSIEHRERIKADFIAKKITGLIATDIFGEGQDIPSIDVLINARLQESEIQTRQGIGRALRLAKGTRSIEESRSLGKDKAEIFDFLIEGNRYLQGHSLSRIDQYRSEPEFTVEIEA